MLNILSSSFWELLRDAKCTPGRGRKNFALIDGGGCTILGHVVDECPTADQALIALEGTVSFSLIITDVRTPGRLDGLVLVRTIWFRWPYLHVIIMSGNTVIPPGFLRPNAKYLPKPVHLDSLHGAIVELLPQAGYRGELHGRLPLFGNFSEQMLSFAPAEW
ncbi:MULTISPECIES: hypothetical protein [unclassified Pseudomonas]|uniref:hypothetical protein n=1 Tax=unclassified Pseudomonas TaxID=196821 RepID=UPI00211E875E|nr:MULTISPECIES: hypothetical protein [unclassified Pseudomonas]